MSPPPPAQPAAAPRVSIVIPVWNGADTLPALLEAVAAQDTDFAYEVLAIDSGSRDGSLELLRGEVDRLMEIPGSDFDHGLTRNLGIRSSRGEFVVLLVQDAVPASPSWLRELIRPLRDDPRVAGSYARQLPRPEASRIARVALERWTAAEPRPRTSALPEAGGFEALSPEERHALCVFDNVCSCLRRSVWEQHPFRATPIAEDLEWAREVLLAGWKLAYAPAAEVVHSHDRGLAYEYRRSYAVHQRLYALFGMRLIPSLGALPGAVLWHLRDHLRTLRHAEGPRPDLAELLRALGLAAVWPLGQYLGGRAGSRAAERELEAGTCRPGS